jgi:hypothetical protein
VERYATKAAPLTTNVGFEEKESIMNAHRWTFTILGNLLALAFAASGCMICFLSEGWTRAGGVGPILMGVLIHQYISQTYGQDTDRSKAEGKSNNRQEHISKS